MMPLQLRKTLLLLLLLQLSFTLWPAFISLLMGVPFAIYLDGQDRCAARHWDDDMRREFSMNRWDAIAPTEPYMIPSLWTTEWQNQLGMVGTSYGSTINSFGAPEHLEALPGVPSQWVYLPESGTDMTGLWDSAFDQLIQYHYIHSPAHDALFSVLDSNKSAFLDVVWHVKRPALVFFSIADSPYEDDRVNDETQRSRAHRSTPQSPVVVHVAELPLSYHVPGPLLSCFDQMLLLTNGTMDALTLPRWAFFQQAHARFLDYYNEIQSRSRALQAINNVDSWLTSNLPFLNSQIILRYFYVVTINVPLFAFEVHNHYIAPTWQRYVAYRKGPLMIALHANPYDSQSAVDQDVGAVDSQTDQMP